MSQQYQFTKYLQQKILAALWFNNESYGIYKDTIKPKYFTDQILADLCRIIFDYRDKYKSPPTAETLIEEVTILCKPKNKENQLNLYKDMIQTLKNIELYDIEYIKDKIISFGKQRALIEAILSSSEIVSTANMEQYSKIETNIRKALMVGEDITDLGTNFFENIEERLRGYTEKDTVIEKISTGIGLLDQVLQGGLGRSEMGVIVAPPGTGKALIIGTKVITPKGYVSIEDLKPGDDIITVDGTSTKVLNTYYHENKSMYKVTFVDGNSCICCDEHLWQVQRFYNRIFDTNKWEVLTTKQLMNNITVLPNIYNYSIPTLTSPIDFHTDDEYLPISAGLLGIFISNGICINGNLEFRINDSDVIRHINEALPVELILVKIKGNRYRIVTDTNNEALEALKYYLNELGVLYNNFWETFIPKKYLYAPIEERARLLRGILDTNGTVTSSNTIEVTSASYKLLTDIKFVAESLCYIATPINDKKDGYYSIELQHTIDITKQDKNIHIMSIEKTENKINWKNIQTRKIKSIEYYGESPAVCIKIEHPSKLYCIENCIITHNTTTLTAIGVGAMLSGHNVLHVSLENNELQVLRNYETSLLKHNYSYIQENIDACVQSLLFMKNDPHIGELRVKKYPTKGANARTIRTLIEKYMIIQNFKPDVLIVDYGAIMSNSEKFSDRRFQIESNYESLRALADEYNMALWSAAQANRGSLNKEIVSMVDLAECFAIGNIVDVMICLCQTSSERKKEALRLWIPKIRDNADNKLLQGKILYEIKQIEMYEIIGEAEIEESEDDEKVITKTKTSDKIKNAVHKRIKPKKNPTDDEFFND